MGQLVDWVILSRMVGLIAVDVSRLTVSIFIGCSWAWRAVFDIYPCVMSQITNKSALYLPNEQSHLSINQIIITVNEFAWLFESERIEATHRVG